ncbi:MAG: hypothetical protein RLZZ117_1965 [Cyanobacteriota bacterium]|jgi:hypothetical protein
MATKGLSSNGGDGSIPILPIFLSRGGQKITDIYQSMAERVY